MHSTWIFLISLFFSLSSVHALLINETLPTTVKKVSPSGSRMIINRGLSDGLRPKMVAKFYSGKTFICEAVNIENTTYLSEWVIHRIYHPHLIKGNLQFKIINHLGPSRQKIFNWPYFQATSFLKSELRKQEKERAKALQKKPMGTNYRQELKRERAPESDFPPLEYSLFISPLIFHYPQRLSSLTLGHHLKSSEGVKKNNLWGFEHKFRHTGVGLQNSSDGSKSTAQHTYLWLDFWRTLARNSPHTKKKKLFWNLSFQKKKISKQIQPLMGLFSLMPIGLEWSLYPQIPSKGLTVAIGPSFEFYQGHQLDTANELREFREATLRVRLLAKHWMRYGRLTWSSRAQAGPGINLRFGEGGHQNIDLLVQTQPLWDLSPSFQVGLLAQFQYFALWDNLDLNPYQFENIIFLRWKHRNW